MPSHTPLANNMPKRCHTNMASDDICQRCFYVTEILINVVRDCENVQLFWNRVIKSEFGSNFDTYV